MHVILAENLDGWLFAAMLLFGGLGAAALGLVGIAPALLGKRKLALALIIPALVMGIWTIGWLMRGYSLQTTHQNDDVMEDYIKPGLIMAGPPLVAVIAVLGILLAKMLRQK